MSKELLPSHKSKKLIILSWFENFLKLETNEDEIFLLLNIGSPLIFETYIFVFSM